MTVVPRSPWQEECRSGVVLSYRRSRIRAHRASASTAASLCVTAFAVDQLSFVTPSPSVAQSTLSFNTASCRLFTVEHIPFVSSWIQPADTVRLCLQHTQPLKRRPSRALSTSLVPIEQQQQRSCVSMDGTCKLQQTRRSQDFIIVSKVRGRKREKFRRLCVRRSKLTVDSTMRCFGIAMTWTGLRANN